jgi:hypothetical protein
MAEMLLLCKKTTGEPHHVDSSEDVLLTTIEFPVLHVGVEHCL